MRINYYEAGDFGNFKIYPSDETEISQKFIDLETGLLIVVEAVRDSKSWGGKRHYYYTLHPRSGQVIEIADRADHINYAERKFTDQKSGLHWTMKRIHAHNGNESIKIRIEDPSTGELINTSHYFAFSAKAHEAIPKLYARLLKLKMEDEARKKKAYSDYLKKNQEERVRYWSGQLHQQMRWNGESGLDEYAIFTKNWLEEVRKFEPNIESILEQVFSKFFKGYWDIEEIRSRLNIQAGKNSKLN
ncbi:MAG: hypothetical protein MRZ79_13820 [Bacteroidia bacterium]|nr:hypothetical protein [Bacteroidia bacterium]